MKKGIQFLCGSHQSGGDLWVNYAEYGILVSAVNRQSSLQAAGVDGSERRFWDLACAIDLTYAESSAAHKELRMRVKALWTDVVDESMRRGFTPGAAEKMAKSVIGEDFNQWYARSRDGSLDLLADEVAVTRIVRAKDLCSAIFGLKGVSAGFCH